METIKAEFSKEFYDSLNPDQRGQMIVEEVKGDEIDYSHDALWVDLKYTATRAYKKLKEREFKLRNNGKPNK